jgi:hypothetical protein
MGRLFKDREHLWRMAALFGAGIVVFLVMRGLLVPADFGELGHYRTGALDDNRSVAPRFAGRTVCEDCHEDVAGELVGSAHGGIGCEACHGALASHADGTDDGLPEIPDATRLCASCHEMAVAKPHWFPQVATAEHAAGEVCTECHLPHSPAI